MLLDKDDIASAEYSGGSAALAGLVFAVASRGRVGVTNVKAIIPQCEDIDIEYFHCHSPLAFRYRV